jgi:predicted dienelactone hydrolase
MAALTLALALTVAVHTDAMVEVSAPTWQDTARNREVPVKIYAPKEVPAPLPLIVFSHGLGGTRDGYAYLGKYWAAHGYIVVHVQHRGSDAGIFKFGEDLIDSARQAVANPASWRERPQDVRFVIDKMARDSRVNTNAIGVAGHSFGAHTTLEMIGLRVAGESFRDPRVKAAVAMSSPKPRNPLALRDIQTPCLHLTGTQDDSPVFTTKPADRRYVFDHITAPQQWLVTIKDAHHFTFSDNPRWEGKPLQRDPRHQPWVCEMSTKFWDAFLKDDAPAKKWLATGGLQKLLGAEAVVESK